LDRERDRNLEVEGKLRELGREHQQLGLQLMESKENEEELGERNKQLETEILMLTSAMKEAEADRVIAEDIIKDKDQDIAQQENVIEEHLRRIETLKREVQESQFERDKLLASEQSSNTRIASLESVINQQKQTIKELESKMIQSEEMSKRLQEQLEVEAELALEQQHQTRIEQEHAIKTLRSQLESQHAKQMDEQEAQRRKLQRDLSQLIYELEQERKQVIALKETIRKSETESNATTQLESAQVNWRRERERLEMRTKDLQRMQLEACEREEALHAQLTTSAEQARLLRSKIADLEDAMSLVEYQKRTLEARIEAMIEQQRESNASKVSIETVAFKLETRVAELESQQGHLVNDKLALEGRILLDENLLQLSQAELADEKRRVNALMQEKVTITQFVSFKSLE
jgi:chromosome segregation ATPase